MNFAAKSVLLLGPHADDIELGMGGTVAKFAQSGANIRAIIFSRATQSLRDGFGESTLVDESNRALQHLGLSSSAIDCLDFPVRRFDSYRQDILEILVSLKNDDLPDVVFAPSITDTHQDHQVLAHEALRAFRGTSVLGYELPWNTVGFSAQLHSVVSEREMALKEEALRFYYSQHHRGYFEEGVLRGHARMRGLTIGCQYCEAFDVPRLVFK